MPEWEELNKDDPRAEEAITLCKKAVSLFEDIENLLLTASEVVGNTPESDRIASIMRDAEDLECATRAQVKRLGGAY